MLVFIGIGVGMLIIIQVLFHIALAVGFAVTKKNQNSNSIGRMLSSSMVEDERDKLISLKSSHAGYICVGIGFIVSLVSLSIGISTVVVLHVILGAFAGGSIVEGILNVYFNERGVRNG
ncbi:MAG: hypothetical protein ACK5LL_04990 [Suipraeoptans sp.]